ncbi:hypothetical protein MFM001_47250 [Mycobacterium sp. MFM001]|uniref:hypothetical protein n=1 Tax=Mycobacterium sp. MFM001 TaxID=2049453 RepID=UPI000DA494C5|nr:hypothetical protein [Mycobacterium sp. MFM001]GBE68263.1 hypothetical protein MFM001_47250 [Mycobacterium sp. MFM001]
MPDRSFRERVNETLRDDILAQLRTARRPMSTSELRAHAPHLPLRPGGGPLLAPLQEQVYRALCVLRRQGKVAQHQSRGRIVTWVATHDADEDDEIADLEAAFHQQLLAPSDPVSPIAADEVLGVAVEHLKFAAGTTAQLVNVQPAQAAPVTAAFIAVVSCWADVIGAARHHPHGGRTGLVPATVKGADQPQSRPVAKQAPRS